MGMNADENSVGYLRSWSSSRALSDFFTFSCCHFSPLHVQSPKALSGYPNQVVSASLRSGWVSSPTQATYPSGRINTAVGADTKPNAGRSHGPSYLPSTNLIRSDHGLMSKLPGAPRFKSNGR